MTTIPPTTLTIMTISETERDTDRSAAHLETSWGCRTGRGRRCWGVQSPGSPGPRWSRKGSWAPRCWGRPPSCASTRSGCGSSSRPGRAWAGLRTPGPPACWCWSGSGPAGPVECSSSNTWRGRYKGLVQRVLWLRDRKLWVWTPLSTVYQKAYLSKKPNPTF